MNLSVPLQRLLATLSEREQLNFPQLWEAVYKVRFTGPVTFHCRNGQPFQVDLGAPVKLSICQGVDAREQEEEREREREREREVGQPTRGVDNPNPGRPDSTALR